MPLSVKSLHPLFAAEVTGLDLRRPVSATEAREFVAAMDRCGVGVLPEQFIDDAQQVAFARLFGELEMRPIQRGRNRYPGADERIRHHEIFDVSNLDAYGKMLARTTSGGPIRSPIACGTPTARSARSRRHIRCCRRASSRPATPIPNSPTSAPPMMRCRKR